MRDYSQPQHKYSKEEWRAIVDKCDSIADICRMCGWKPTGGNYRTVHQYNKDYGIDISHFLGKGYNIGNANGYYHRSLEELLQVNSRASSKV